MMRIYDCCVALSSKFPTRESKGLIKLFGGAVGKSPKQAMQLVSAYPLSSELSFLYTSSNNRNKLIGPPS